MEQLANEWNIEELQDWGLDLPIDFNLNIDEDKSEIEDDVPEIQEKIIVEK
jgi:hypothetical protein